METTAIWRREVLSTPAGGRPADAADVGPFDQNFPVTVPGTGTGTQVPV